MSFSTHIKGNSVILYYTKLCSWSNNTTMILESAFASSSLEFSKLLFSLFCFKFTEIWQQSAVCLKID